LIDNVLAKIIENIPKVVNRKNRKTENEVNVYEGNGDL
jgi:hypothetical protein